MVISCPGVWASCSKVSPCVVGEFEETLNRKPCIPTVPDTVPFREKREVSSVESFGHRTLCIPTVANPTTPPINNAMKQSAIFSLHACCFCLSLSPPKELSKTPGAQKETILEKMRQTSQSDSGGDLLADIPEGEGKSVTAGLINGTGATPRSGRVRVFARRIVPVAGCLVTAGREVGIGTSLES